MDDAAASVCVPDDGGVVMFSLVAFTLVVGMAFGVVERGDERGLS